MFSIQIRYSNEYSVAKIGARRIFIFAQIPGSFPFSRRPNVLLCMLACVRSGVPLLHVDTCVFFSFQNRAERICLLACVDRAENELPKVSRKQGVPDSSCLSHLLSPQFVFELLIQPRTNCLKLTLLVMLAIATNW